jgi:aminoglycoside phosphotransferase (APT) family kinase protein
LREEAEAESLLERKDALERYLANSAESERVEIVEAAPLTGGAIQENWRLTIKISGGPWEGALEAVLRTDAPSAVAVSLGRAQEFALLKAAQQAGVTVPEPLWLCEDRSVIGRPFYLMRFLPGVALGPKVVKDLSLGGDREQLAERLGREMARIHTIRPPREDLSFLEYPEGSPALHALSRYRQYLDEMSELRPALEWGLAWCEHTAPAAPAQLVLVHQDFRTGNYLVDGQGLLAILDWEFCAWGDPMSDLGWFLAACWRFGRPDLEAGGIGSREAFYRGYGSESDIAIDEAAVAYWEVMAHIRWAVIALQQGARHHSGAEKNLELALTGRHIARLERSILQMTSPERWKQRHD